jgi:hypothetical protein
VNAERLLTVALLPEALEALGVGDERSILSRRSCTDAGTTTGLPPRRK